MSSPSSDHIGTIYRFCSQSMHFPESSWFNLSYINGLFTLLDALETDLDDIKSIRHPDDLNGLLESLQIEYTRMFINGVPHVTSPPYGSVYLEKTLRGNYSDEVLSFYREHGYDLDDGSDLPDNIIYQLEFLSFLAKERNHNAETEFLRRFFLPWFPNFAQRVIDESSHPFYPTIIRIIDFFTKEEKAYGV